MKTSAKFAAIAASFLITATPLSGSFAASTEPVTATAPYATQASALQPSAAAQLAMLQIKQARLALFDGGTDSAKSLVDAALLAMNDNVDPYFVKGVDAGHSDTVYLPLESWFEISEGFSLAENQRPAMAEAAGQFKAGSPGAALQVLRSAQIGVTMGAALLPFESGIAGLRDAAQLMDEGKYYEANLALKSVEASVVVEAFAIDAIPSQGAQG